MHNDCSPFLAETDNLLSNTLPASKDHQRPMRCLKFETKSLSVINVHDINCVTVYVLWLVWILSFRLTELHLFISDVFAMNLL